MNYLDTIKIYNNLPKSLIDKIKENFSDQFEIKISDIDDFDFETYKLEICHYEQLPKIYKSENTFYYLYVDSNDPIPALENTDNFQPFKNYENFSMSGTEDLFCKSLEKIIKRLKLSFVSHTYTILECD